MGTNEDDSSVRKPGYLNEVFEKKNCDVTGGGGGDVKKCQKWVT